MTTDITKSKASYTATFSFCFSG